MRKWLKKFARGLLLLWVFISAVAFAVILATVAVMYFSGSVTDEQLDMIQKILRGKEYHEDKPDEAEMRARIEELRKKIEELERERGRRDAERARQGTDVKTFLEELKRRLEEIEEESKGLKRKEEVFNEWKKKEEERLSGYKETLEFLGTLPPETAAELLLERPNTASGNAEIGEILIRVKEHIAQTDYLTKMITALMARNLPRTKAVVDELMKSKVLSKD